MDSGVLTANEAVVRSALDALNRRDLAGLRPLWHPEVVEARIAASTRLLAALPDLRVTPLVVACEDDDVLVHWRARGTFTGEPLRGLHPTGKRVAIDGFARLTFERGLLRHDVVTYDGTELARQLGVLPAAGSLADRVLTLALNLRTRLLP